MPLARVIVIAALLFANLATTDVGPAVAQSVTEPLQVRTWASHIKPYVNEQTLLQREVTADPRAFSLTGTHPTIEGVDLLQIFEYGVSNERNQVLRTHWAMFPRDHGEIVIGKHAFQATLPATGGSNPTLKAQSQAIKISVLKPPTGPTGSVWFPAAKLTISQQWLDPNSTSPGEPRRLQVIVTATGQRAAAIPPFGLPSAPNLRFYPEPPELTDQISRSGITGIRTQTFSVVPGIGGEIHGPRFSLHWFDTSARAWMQTNSEPLKLLVKAPMDTQRVNIWSILLGVVVTTFALGLLIRRRRTDSTVHHTRGIPLDMPGSEASAWRALQRAIATTESSVIHAALTHWSKQRWPNSDTTPIEHLKRLASTQPNEQIQSLVNLTAIVYGKQAPSSLDLAALKRLLVRLRAHGTQREKNTYALEPLYRSKTLR